MLLLLYQLGWCKDWQYYDVRLDNNSVHIVILVIEYGIVSELEWYRITIFLQHTQHRKNYI